MRSQKPVYGVAAVVDVFARLAFVTVAVGEEDLLLDDEEDPELEGLDTALIPLLPSVTLLEISTSLLRLTGVPTEDVDDDEGALEPPLSGRLVTAVRVPVPPPSALCGAGTPYGRPFAP